jgi:hypothetical protein
MPDNVLSDDERKLLAVEIEASKFPLSPRIWAPADDGKGAVKVDITAKAGKEPGTDIRTVRPWKNQYLGIEEVREVTADIINERHHLGEIVQCFQNPNPEEAERLVQLLKPPPRLHLLRRQERQRQTAEARAAELARQRKAKSRRP